MEAKGTSCNWQWPYVASKLTISVNDILVLCKVALKVAGEVESNSHPFDLNQVSSR